MLVGLILGLFLSSSQEVKQQTQKHLMAMRNMSAIETAGKQSYKVALYGGQQHGTPPPYKHGPQVQQAWYVLLRDSQVWKWLDHSGRPTKGLFSYDETCGWNEEGKLLIVPCSGFIITEGNDVRRIIQNIEPPKWGIVHLDIKFGFVDLSERRLVPQSLTLGWRDKTITATWSGYQEYRGTEPRVSEAEADDEITVNGAGDYRRSDTAGISADREGESNTTPNRNASQGASATDLRGDVRQDGLPALLTPPSNAVWKEVKIESKWKRFLKRIWRKQ